MSLIYDYAKFAGFASGTVYAWISTSILATLVSNNYTPSPGDRYASALSGAELSGGTWSGSFTGNLRQLLLVRTENNNTTSDQTEYNAQSLTWSGISAGTVYGIAILAHSNAANVAFSAGNVPLLAFLSTTATVTNSGSFTASWANSGLIVLASG